MDVKDQFQRGAEVIQGVALDLLQGDFLLTTLEPD